MSCRNRHDGVSRNDDADWLKDGDGGVAEEVSVTSHGPDGEDNMNTEWSKYGGGVVEELPATNDDPDCKDDIKTASKPRDVDLIAAEISTIDAVINSAVGSATTKLPSVVNGVEDISDTASTVSDDTPPSTPSSRGSSSGRRRRRSRRRKPSLQDSHVSISSSPARGLTVVFGWHFSPSIALLCCRSVSTMFFYQTLYTC